MDGALREGTEMWRCSRPGPLLSSGCAGLPAPVEPARAGAKSPRARVEMESVGGTYLLPVTPLNLVAPDRLAAVRAHVDNKRRKRGAPGVPCRESRQVGGSRKIQPRDGYG